MGVVLGCLLMLALAYFRVFAGFSGCFPGFCWKGF